jgi:hypothetical protein
LFKGLSSRDSRHCRFISLNGYLVEDVGSELLVRPLHLSNELLMIVTIDQLYTSLRVCSLKVSTITYEKLSTLRILKDDNESWHVLTLLKSARDFRLDSLE